MRMAHSCTIMATLLPAAAGSMLRHGPGCWWRLQAFSAWGAITWTLSGATLKRPLLGGAPHIHGIPAGCHPRAGSISHHGANPQRCVNTPGATPDRRETHPSRARKQAVSCDASNRGVVAPPNCFCLGVFLFGLRRFIAALPLPPSHVSDRGGTNPFAPVKPPSLTGPYLPSHRNQSTETHQSFSGGSA
jgi:hypothetical protein